MNTCSSTISLKTSRSRRLMSTTQTATSRNAFQFPSRYSKKMCLQHPVSWNQLKNSFLIRTRYSTSFRSRSTKKKQTTFNNFFRTYLWTNQCLTWSWIWVLSRNCWQFLVWRSPGSAVIISNISSSLWTLWTRSISVQAIKSWGSGFSRMEEQTSSWTW